MIDFNITTSTDPVPEPIQEKKKRGRPRTRNTPAKDVEPLFNPPAERDPYDLAPIRAQFAAYSQAIDNMVAVSVNHQVTDDESLKEAITLAGNATILNKEIDRERKEILDAPNRFAKAVNSFCKEFQTRLDTIAGGLKKKIADHQYRMEIARRKAEADAREAAEKLQEKVNAEAAEAGVPAPIVAAPVLPDQGTVTRAESGTSAFVRKEWTFEITDPAAIPREYLIPDERRIREAVRMGIREIAGVKIFEKSSTVLRT